MVDKIHVVCKTLHNQRPLAHDRIYSFKIQVIQSVIAEDTKKRLHCGAALGFMFATTTHSPLHGSCSPGMR